MLNTTKNTAATTVSVVAIASILYFAYLSAQPPTQVPLFVSTDFKFDVYCPINTQQAANYINQYSKIRVSPSNLNDLYVVYMIAKQVSSNIIDPITGLSRTITNTSLLYCGLTREWQGSCTNPRFVCSNPGPLFILPTGKQVTIGWINNIDGNNIQWPNEGCYNPSNPKCFNDAKIFNVFTQQQGCTYNDPTNYGYRAKQVQVNRKQVPTSPHIHGLQIRPTFDGNPLAWFTKQGDKGVGFFSLQNSKYFSMFQNSQNLTTRPGNFPNIKIIKAANVQLPGFLLYHDHAMKTTQFNIQHGLKGGYILYDAELEKNLPAGNGEQIIIFLTHQIYLDNAVYPTKGMSSASIPLKVPQMDKVYCSKGKNSVLSRGVTYRFRVVNLHVDNTYYNISLVTLTNNVNGISTQINPSDYPNIDLTPYINPLSFTVVGVDSAILHKPIPNMQQFNLGVAQRLQFVVNFNQNAKISPQTKFVYLVAFDMMANQVLIKASFSLSGQAPVNYVPKPIIPPPLNLKFTDLSKMTWKNIAMNRMRPLISRPFDQRFLINGHYMFNMGFSQNPQIGTVQDWYLINTVKDPHPIHLHLQQFQVVATFNLKLTAQNCTFYQLDYFRFSNYSDFPSLNDAQLCNRLNTITLAQTDRLYNYLSSYYPQNLYQDKQIGKVSGLNIYQVFNPTSFNDKRYLAVNSNFPCPLGTKYKYICLDTTSTLPPHYKRWKDTVLVNNWSVSVIRVRWAAITYDPSVRSYPYYHTPQDHLTEFPGFVYHCHILPHEDNQMMRPIMLRPSDIYLNRLSQSQQGKIIQKFGPSIAQKFMNSLNNKNSNMNINNFSMMNSYLKQYQSKYYAVNTKNYWQLKAFQINQALSCLA